MKINSEYKPKILMSARRSKKSFGYVDYLVEGLRKNNQEVSYFTWKKALFTKFDIFHIHWPETLLRNRIAPVQMIQYSLTYPLLLLKIKLSKVKIVYTLHNITPHESGPKLEHSLLKLILNKVKYYILLNPSNFSTDNKPYSVILHGDYHKFYPAKDNPQNNTLIFFGGIRKYKNVPHLLNTFKSALKTRSNVKLKIVGSSRDADVKKEIISKAKNIPSKNISLKIHFVSDEELSQEISSSQLVVLPYTQMYNSGALLLALTLARPILAPKTTTNKLIQDEIGSEWIYLYEGSLTDKHLLEAINLSQKILDKKPDLSKRTWDKLAKDHVQVYSTVKNL